MSGSRLNGGVVCFNEAKSKPSRDKSVGLQDENNRGGGKSEMVSRLCTVPPRNDLSITVNVCALFQV